MLDISILADSVRICFLIIIALVYVWTRLNFINSSGTHCKLFMSVMTNFMPMAPPIERGFWPVPNRNLLNWTACLHEHAFGRCSSRKWQHKKMRSKQSAGAEFANVLSSPDIQSFLCLKQLFKVQTFNQCSFLVIKLSSNTTN